MTPNRHRLYYLALSQTKYEKKKIKERMISGLYKEEETNDAIMRISLCIGYVNLRLIHTITYVNKIYYIMLSVLAIHKKIPKN